MKRTSMLIVAMLTIAPSVTKGILYSGSLRYRTRYSPYAFSYKHPSGLISGELGYSPYAFGHKSSGLVPYWVRYSPYAFSNKHPSGLISDHWSAYAYYDRGFYSPSVVSYRHSALVDCNTHRSAHVVSANHPTANQMNQIYEEKLAARRERIEKLKRDSREINMASQEDGKDVICRYLESRNINFTTRRVLKINDKTVSADFVFSDRNIIIKYWNSEEIKSLAYQQGYKRGYYEKYLQGWKDLCEEYAKAGWTIHEIESANEQEMLAKLDLYTKPNAG